LAVPPRACRTELFVRQLARASRALSRDGDPAAVGRPGSPGGIGMSKRPLARACASPSWSHADSRGAARASCSDDTARARRLAAGGSHRPGGPDATPSYHTPPPLCTHSDAIAACVPGRRALSDRVPPRRAGCCRCAFNFCRASARRRAPGPARGACRGHCGRDHCCWLLLDGSGMDGPWNAHGPPCGWRQTGRTCARHLTARRCPSSPYRPCIHASSAGR